MVWKPRGALFLDLFRSCTFRPSPIRDRKIRAMKKKFANACGLRALNVCKKLTFELSLDNAIKQPQDGPFGW